MKIPVYNCVIDDSVNDITGVYAISFVDLPANEVDFVALSKNKPELLNKNSKKQILTGVVLRPEQLMYRFSEELGEYYIRFSADEIEKIAQKMMKTGVALYNTTHQHESRLDGNYLTELWIVENPNNDKSTALGFKDLPKGTLMCSYKIEDKSYWDSQIMTGNVKGFSLEGFFNQELNLSKIQLNKKNMSKKKKTKLSLADRIYLKARGWTDTQLSEIEKIEKDDSTGSGDTIIEFVLKDGSVVTVDNDGFATLDDEQMPAGDHPLADGNILVIDESGSFVETKEASPAKNDPDEATAKETLAKLTASKKSLERKLQKLEETQSEDKDAEIASLKAIISDMQKTIDELLKALEGATQKVDEAVEEVADAQAQIEELKKVKPSGSPAIQKLSEKKYEDLAPTERMALALQSKVNRRK